MFDEIIRAITQGTPPKTTIKQGPEGSTMTTNIVWDGNLNSSQQVPQDQTSGGGGGWGGSTIADLRNFQEGGGFPVVTTEESLDETAGDWYADPYKEGQWKFGDEAGRVWDETVDYWGNARDPDAAAPRRWITDAVDYWGTSHDKTPSWIRENVFRQKPSEPESEPKTPLGYMDKYGKKVADRSLGTGDWKDQFRLEANEDSNALRRSLNKQQEAADAEAKRAESAISTASDNYASRFQGYDFAERAKNERRELLRRANRIVTQGFMLDMMAMAMGKDYRGSQAYIEGSLANLETEAQYGNADRLTDMTKALYFRPDGTYDPPQSREEAFEALTMMGADTETAAAISGKIAEGKEYYVKDPSSATGYRIERSKPKSGEEYTTSASVAGQWGPRSDNSTATERNLRALENAQLALMNPDISDLQRRMLAQRIKSLKLELGVDEERQLAEDRKLFMDTMGGDWMGKGKAAAVSYFTQMVGDSLPSGYIDKITSNPDTAFMFYRGVKMGYPVITTEAEWAELPSGTTYVMVLPNGKSSTRTKP